MRRRRVRLRYNEDLKPPGLLLAVCVPADPVGAAADRLHPGFLLVHAQPFAFAHARHRARLLPRVPLDHLWVVSVLGLAALFISVLPLPPNDLWWQWRLGA